MSINTCLCTFSKGHKELLCLCSCHERRRRIAAQAAAETRKLKRLKREVKAVEPNAYARRYRGRWYVSVYTSVLDKHRQHKFKNIGGPAYEEVGAWEMAKQKLSRRQR